MSPFEQKLTGNITHDQAVSLVDINERLHEAAKVKNPRDPKNVAALLQLVEKYSKEFEDDLDEIKLGKKVLFDVFNFENLGIYQIMKVVPIAGGAVIIGRRASDFIIVDNKGKVLSENLREVNNLVSVGDSFVATGKRGSHPSRFHNDFHEDIVIIRKNGEDLRYKNFSGVSVKNVGGHEIIFTDDGYKRNKETVVASLMIDGQEQEWASNYSYFTSFCFYHNQIVCVGSRDKKHFLLIDGEEVEELFSCLNVNEIFTDGEDGLYVKYRDEFNKHYGIKQIRGKNQKFLDDRILNMVGNSIIWEGKALYVADNDFPRNTVMASDSAEPLIIIENGKELTKVGDGFVIADYASDGLRLVNHEGEACIRVGIFDAISFVKPIKDNICKVYGVKDGQAICVTVDIMEPVSEEDLSN